MCLLILTSKDLDIAAKTLLKRAYDRAEAEITALPGVSPDDVDADALASALLSLYNAGEREERLLSQRAVFRALQAMIIAEPKRA